MSLIAFYFLASIILGSALLVILSTNPVNSAVALIVSLFGIAALFALAGNGFLAIIQVLIYAGAVLTLFIFVVMLLNLRDEELSETGVNFQKVAGALVAALLFVNLTAVNSMSTPLPGEVQISYKDIMQLVSQAVFNRFALAFELTSALLLVAVIGVVTLARREKGA